MQIRNMPLGENSTKEVKQATRPTSFIRNILNKLTILLALLNRNNNQRKSHWSQKPLGIQTLNTMIPSVNSRANERILITSKGKNSRGVWEVNGINNVWLVVKLAGK